MCTTKERFGLSDEKVQEVIEDFLEHLPVAGLKIVDTEDSESCGDAYILDNYMCTFTR